MLVVVLLISPPLEGNWPSIRDCASAVFAIVSLLVKLIVVPGQPFSGSQNIAFNAIRGLVANFLVSKDKGFWLGQEVLARVHDHSHLRVQLVS